MIAFLNFGCFQLCHVQLVIIIIVFMTLCLADLEVSKVPKFKTILLDIVSTFHGGIELNQVLMLFCFSVFSPYVYILFLSFLSNCLTS
jgi:hypothetical protein